MYFLTYESLIHRDTSKGIKREDIPEWRLCLYGALYLPSWISLITDLAKQCGYLRILWVSPFWDSGLITDVIKSRLQTDIIGPGRKYSSAFDCAMKSYRAEGLGTFFRGIGPTLARAAPVNAMVPPSPESS
jgi:solute carrier family 25 (mitochondrial carnitine/acylcarnitine transporter), member 20/29